MRLVPCPLCPEMLDEEDPVAAGAHMGEHIGVVDLGPLHSLGVARHGLTTGLIMVAGRGPCECPQCEPQEREEEPSVSAGEQQRLDFLRAFGG